ncbi:MAG TPA: phosphatidylglycerol lysyltransferase domain-containing protein, partial [Verrucomicrobiae bacterium]|nr:phosphatidylglycerol lysyltransferase domain-containing protein [Verrucomicrobiae bacterium]
VPEAIRRWDGRPVAMTLVAALDWLLAWLVFHLTMTGMLRDVDVMESLSAFFLGQLIGLASFIPGGLGSADFYWTISLTAASGSRDHVVAALILYRVLFYVIPWAIATLVLVGRLVRTGRRTGAFIRTAMASYTFLCGAVLLASAATPALAARAHLLTKSVPLALIDISYGLSIVLGFLLLVISRGLARGYRSSHKLALALFFAGSLTTFLKGLDFEEALFSLSAAAFLLIFQQSFVKTGRLRPPVEFIVSVGLFAVVFFGAIGYGSLSDLPNSAPPLRRLEYLPYEHRFLKGLFVLSSIAAIATLHFTLRARPHDRMPADPEIDEALRRARSYGRGTNPLMVAGGDKAIFSAAAGDGGAGEGEGFIAYRTSGRFVVGYSDPVCPPGKEREILSAFLDHASASDRDAILYQISAAFLPVAHDFGFSFFKLGEEAIVDLHRFDLKGNKAKTWRSAVNGAERAGARFEILEGDALLRAMPELREVSDDWLAHKHVVEKRFSVGRFDAQYLRRFPCAVVRNAAGRIEAFANILEGPAGGEISVDLMRYRAQEEAGADALPNVMDYLFIRLILLGKERGYSRFNLGMAPLAAVGEERWARPFERLAHFFFRHGEHWYNYQGLRRYKEKFDPVWEPRYMAYPRPWDWPLATTSTAVLIAGGWRALLFPRGDSE